MATIIAALLTFCGAVAGALITTIWKREPKHQIVEYRLRHEFSHDQSPWIQGQSTLAKAIRAVGWIVAVVLLFIGLPATFVVPTMNFLEPSIASRFPTAVTVPWGILSLITFRWITKRIEAPSVDDDDDD